MSEDSHSQAVSKVVAAMDAGKGLPPPEAPPPPANPMHGIDRRLFSDLAIPAAILVAVGAAGLGGIFAGWPHTGAALSVFGFGGALAMRLHLVETKSSPAAKTAGWRAFLLVTAILTWASVGWQTWFAFHKPIQGYTQTQLDEAVAKATNAAPLVQPSDAVTLCSDGPCIPVRLKPGPEYLKGIGLGVGGAEPLLLNGTSALTTSRLRVFVDYSEYRSGWVEKKRVLVGEIKEPVKGESERLQLIYYEKGRPNAGTNNLWWGEPSKEHPVIVSTFNDNLVPALIVRARVAIVGPEGEQHYYFLLIRASENLGTQVGVIPQYEAGDWINAWEKE